MKVLSIDISICQILLPLVAAAFAAPQGYNLDTPSGGGLTHGGSTDGAPGGIGSDDIGGPYLRAQAVHLRATPKVENNILFVRVPEDAPPSEPIIVPPPKQTNVVYVLNKQEEEAQQVIEVTPHPAADPEIYFVNYQEGENPTLPLGVDLETALSVASAAGGEVIGDGGAGAGLGTGGLDGGAGAGGVGSGFGDNGGFGGAAAGVNGGFGGNGAGVGGNGGFGVEFRMSNDDNHICSLAFATPLPSI
ncbi:probable H/ACA ribonucleoprotein complex subunit 1 [Penaeus japonicus]|uniref:probable H/ACA ribonucleoprotein complex subunit 1 n=1 Tax=Penaeus japonicus TaxID=27405 RepID=UPI001C71792D|nr:probable H/ACA ribonucleoprotein complex subunit 1 [Penaeus japonicus]